MKKVVDKIFNNVSLTPEDLEKRYPSRNLPEGAFVTRLGPSPTGFIHMGNLYGAFVDERLAHQSGGKFYLRIEDTDDKRLVEGAVEQIIEGLKYFGVEFDEGALAEGEMGDYGPYTQSERVDIYHVYAKKLMEEGKAYPCFLTEEEIAEIRQNQENSKATPGIYGDYSKYRNAGEDTILELIESGQPYVVRLKSDGVEGENAKYISVQDGIRGELSIPENFHDTVILKTNGVPTYHFAHVVDDHLMRTTHVVRGEEWLSTLPIHIELFEKLGFEIPMYCHTAQLMKIDETGNKRKLSKRKDPELSLGYYTEQGYHPLTIREYLLTILNSNFEEWRIANPDADANDFAFTMAKMSTSGALFDMNKLDDVSKDVLLKLNAKELYDFLVDWSKQYDESFYKLIVGREDYLLKILDLGRDGNKPRKDLVYAKQIVKFISYFFEERFVIEDELPAEVVEDKKVILEKYLASYNHSDNQETWFNKIREIADELGYALRPKDYKKNPNQFKGHVGHVSTVVRLAVMGRTNSPDIWEIQQILGEEITRKRLEKFA
ncbi:MAG: glutamate--tRNA ligase [Eubacteriales bacterium]|nr:glutamate--tRNA ligase [Eubacteriales bacterium]MDY3332504.1 glutamate--tRNA ligase [Gallibacter sp.]